MNRTITTFRDPVSSMWQYAITKAVSQKTVAATPPLAHTSREMRQFSTALTALQQGQPVPATDAEGLPIENCAKLAAELAWAVITHNTQKAEDLQNQLQYGTCDPVWTLALAEFLAWKASDKLIPYVRYQNLNDFIIPLPSKPDLVIGIVADWGTGLDDAKWVLSELMKKAPDVLIHLGDIYYAGTKDENNNNFLKVVNALAPGIPVYTLSGNHDMYSGGEGYYWVLGQLNTSSELKKYQQQASYFCLRSANWQILAMDTGYNDSDLPTVDTNVTRLADGEPDWHIDKLKNAGGRKTILLSHHQLFTAYGGGVGKSKTGQSLAYNPNLYAVFGPYLPNVALWLWGHEHNFDYFKPYLGLGKGRCVGASAIPSLKDQNPYGLIGNPDLQGQASLPQWDDSGKMTKLQITKDGGYFHDYAVITLRSPDSRIKDSEIRYYEVDSCNKGESILIGGETI